MYLLYLYNVHPLSSDSKFTPSVNPIDGNLICMWPSDSHLTAWSQFGITFTLRQVGETLELNLLCEFSLVKDDRISGTIGIPYKALGNTLEKVARVEFTMKV